MVFLMPLTKNFERGRIQDSIKNYQALMNIFLVSYDYFSQKLQMMIRKKPKYTTPKNKS